MKTSELIKETQKLTGVYKKQSKQQRINELAWLVISTVFGGICKDGDLELGLQESIKRIQKFKSRKNK